MGDFEGISEDELSFNMGQEVLVLEKSETGWWYAKIGQAEGWYVRIQCFIY
jgi:hypothetical protein